MKRLLTVLGFMLLLVLAGCSRVPDATPIITKTNYSLLVTPSPAGREQLLSTITTTVKLQPTVIVPSDSAVPLLLVTYKGGKCVYGECFRQYSFTDDGMLLIENGKDTPLAVTLEANDLAQLKDVISNTSAADFPTESVDQRCPKVMDVPMPTYTFYKPEGPIMWADCAFNSDHTLSIIQQIDTLITNYAPKP